jgi:chemotaxis signal transduction protein
VSTPEPSTSRPWCLFKSDSRPFAVALEDVAEVVDVERLVRLSHSPPHILGLCSVRRDILPIVALTLGPGGTERVVEVRPVAMILRTSQGTWGIRIDREGTVVTEGAPDDIPVPAQAADGPAIVGLLHRGDQAHAVIDAEQTWRNVRTSVEHWYSR